MNNGEERPKKIITKVVNIAKPIQVKVNVQTATSMANSGEKSKQLIKEREAIENKDRQIAKPIVINEKDAMKIAEKQELNKKEPVRFEPGAQYDYKKTMLIMVIMIIMILFIFLAIELPMIISSNS